MITFLKGRLIEKTPTEIVVECGGIGYEVSISLHSYSLLPADENILIYTHLQVREDAHTLYGFMEKSERQIFKLLIAVSGIGANTARNMLSYITPSELMNAIANADVATLKGVKGVGPKTAQRIVLELQEKVLKLGAFEDLSVVNHNTNTEEALSALEVLGFNRKMVEKVIKKIVENNPDATSEMIIKQALKNL
ncbi:MAG TPA: Holliday junction branch migration protein RuvA [Flavobacterium sp.]|nr:Holliday junction branch migration protein RuvA [Flavobacterium sp.]